MIGLTYSTSHNACIIRFVGGPWDGKTGLFDHDKYDGICDGRGATYKRIAPRTFGIKERRSGIIDRRKNDFGK